MGNRIMRAATVVIGLLLAASQLAFADDKPGVNELVKQLRSEDRDTRRDAAYALSNYGPDAKAAVSALASVLDDRDTQVWQQATQALARLGPLAEEALDELLERMDSNDEQRRYRTAYAIGQIGSAALPAVRERLADNSANVREVAIRAIGWMRDDASAAAWDVVKCLDDDEELNRATAIQTLGRMGARITPMLVEAASHESVPIRAGAASALSLIGMTAIESTDALIGLATDESAEVRAAAFAALGHVSITDSKAIKALISGLSDSDLAARQTALEALVRTAPALRDQTAQWLEKLLPDADAELAGRIAFVLGSFGDRGAPAMEGLLASLGQHPDVSEISDAIGRIGTPALEPTFAALRGDRIGIEQVNRIISGMPAQVKLKLVGMATDESPLVREIATHTLGTLVPRPSNANELLVGSLRDKAANVRAAAADSLAAGGKKSKPVLTQLTEAAVAESDPEARSAMVRAVSQLQADGETLVEFLKSNLKQAQAVQVAALNGLGKRERLPGHIQEQLVSLARHESEAVRRAATKAIVLVRENREETLKVVLSALKDESELVREQALLSVAKLGEAASGAVGVISEQLHDESTEVRIAAIESLARIGEPALAAFEDVADLAGDAETIVRQTAIKSVRDLTDDPDRLLPVLIRGVEDAEWEVRRHAANELGEMEEDAAPAIPALLTMLRNDDESDAARRAISDINTAGDEAVPLLVDILQDKKSGRRTRYYALYLLRKMKSRAASALPVLRELLEESDGRVRESYERAIREIEKSD